MSKKIVYYNDELIDDFSGTRIKQKPLKENFKYINRDPIWNFIAWVFYYFIAIPVGWIFSKIKLRTRFKNKKALRKNFMKGYFLYCNHTQGVADAFNPALAVYPKRNFILVNKDAVSIPGLTQVVKMLGGIPVATTLNNMKNMNKCIQERIKNKHVVTIYPEATIWPFNTMIRNFKPASFRYPVELNAPVYASTLVYRKRKGITRLLTRRPFATIYIDGPFYPDKTLPNKEAMKKLRDEVFEAMNKRANVSTN
jgi:1-acyl-sn-glycerol-3-phosphate acyltransferase